MNLVNSVNINKEKDEQSKSLVNIYQESISLEHDPNKWNIKNVMINSHSKNKEINVL